MPRQMRDPTYRNEEWARRMEPHVAPINTLVDELHDPDGRGWLPYVAPAHGGVDALVLSVLRDPGPKTQAGTGSGFLSVENDDPTAARMHELFTAQGVPLADVLPWNAYPWYINRSPSAAERQAGVDPLLRLLDVATAIRVVLLQGNDARDVWRRATKARPDLLINRDLRVVETIHPGRQALFVRDPLERARRRQSQEDAFRLVGEAVAEIRAQERPANTA